MSYLKLIIILLPQLFLATSSSAQSPSCYDPMEIPGRCLPWGYLDLTSVLGGEDGYLAIDLSRDGSALAGLGFPLETVSWNLAEGVRVFDHAGAGISNPKLYLHGPVMSENGSFIAADGLVSGESRAFRWDVEAGDAAALVLPVGPAQVPSEPDVTVTPRIDVSISGDAQTIVGRGEAFFDTGAVFSPTWPFVWTNANGTDGGPQQDFTFLFVPHTIDGLGSRIAGREFTNDIPSEERAAFWTASGGSTVVGSFPESRFTASSYNGDVLAGYRFDSQLQDRVGFRWTSTSGIQDITTFGFQPRAVSDDGTLISGSITTATRQPWIWRQGDSPSHLYDHLNFNYGLDDLKDPVIHLNDHAIVSGDGNVFTVTGTQWVAKVSPLRVVALGDSYSSGEGAVGAGHSYIPPTDSQGPPENRCHRSTGAYSARIKAPTSAFSYRDLEDMHPEFSWDFIACSGATTSNVTRGGEFRSGEAAQLSQDKVDGDTDLVTITIGGNDALFGGVLTFCLMRANCAFDFIDPSTTLRSYVSGVINNPVRDAVRDIYAEIKSESEDGATVIALGYPLLLSEDNNCAEALLLGFDERRFLREMGLLLNEVLASAAREAGVHFVPVAAAFEGRNVCDENPFILGIKPFEQVHSFHPSVSGQALYARVFEDYFETKFHRSYSRGFFESGMPRNPAPVP